MKALTRKGKVFILITTFKLLLGTLSEHRNEEKKHLLLAMQLQFVFLRKSTVVAVTFSSRNKKPQDD